MEKKIKIHLNQNKYDWLEFINRNRSSLGITKLIVDLDKCKFLEPFHLVSLACLLEEYKNNGSDVIFMESDGLALNEYLKKIRFISYWEDNFDRTIFQQNINDTNLFLWKLEKTRIYPYSDFARKYFEQQYSNSKDMEPLSIIFAELFNNIIDHSKSPVSGFTTTQYFPTQQKIRIAICDLGIGIVESVTQYLSKKGQSVLPETAFEKALLKGFSTESTPRNRGYGLDNLLAIVKSNGGKLRIQTNNILYIYSDCKSQTIKTKFDFTGTHIDVILNIDNFYEKEEQNLDNFDF